MISFDRLDVKEKFTSYHLYGSVKYLKCSELIWFNSQITKRHLDKKTNHYRASNVYYNKNNKFNQITKDWEIRLNDQCIRTIS